MDFGRRTKRDAARAALGREAAQIIEARIADGRPPPEVWRAAADRQAAKGLPADAWYQPVDAPAAGGPRAAPPRGDLPPDIGNELVLRVVTLDAAPPSAVAPKRGAKQPKIVADAAT